MSRAEASSPCDTEGVIRGFWTGGSIWNINLKGEKSFNVEDGGADKGCNGKLQRLECPASINISPIIWQYPALAKSEPDNKRL